MDEVLINIGNTHTVFAATNGQLLNRVPTSEGLAVAKELSFSRAWCVSVVSEASQLLQKEFGGRVNFLKATDCSEIDFSEVDVSTVGADRLANILAANSLYPDSAVLILDCGTCITAELLLNGAFKGGFIQPGRMIQRKSLTDYTSALPKTELSELIPVLVGQDTNAAIKSGIDWIAAKGLVAAVRELEGIYEELKIIITGGDAAFFSQELIDAEVISDLTLKGLAVYSASFS